MTQLWQIKQVESIFQADRFDLHDYLQATNAYPKLAAVNDAASRDFCGQPAQDAFFDLYKTAPRLADPCPQALSPLRSLIERGRETPEYEKLRQGSIGDYISAAVGAEVFVEQVMRALPEELKEATQQQAKAEAKADEARQRSEAAAEMARLLAEIADEAAQAGALQKAADLQAEATATEAQAMEAATEAARWQAKADTAGKQAEQALSDYAPQIQAALNNAAANAGEQAQESKTLVQGFSLAAGSETGYVDPDSVRGIMELMRKQPNLKLLAELLGWARQMVRAEWRKSPRGHVKMTGYHKQPLQPSKMASFELARMVSPAEPIRQDWQRRAADNAVQHRQFEGESQEGRGPLVLVRDESGSMQGGSHSLAVALEWALLEIARRDNRDFVSIPFSGSGQYQVWRAPKAGSPDVPGLLAHLGHFYGGGTEPYQPLRAALAEIEQNKLKADVLLLTDGDFAQPPADFLSRLAAAREERPVKVVAVVIGSMNWQAEQFCDKVIFVNDLLADKEKLRSAVGEVV
ncbi:MAG: hypothetical protein KJ077_51585 [Anaerolineae bacterium]|nr:hypothetical protein [Anaerolineae bacterium]